MKKLKKHYKKLVAMGLAASLVLGGVCGYVTFYKKSQASEHMNQVLETVSKKRAEVLSNASGLSQNNRNKNASTSGEEDDKKEDRNDIEDQPVANASAFCKGDYIFQFDGIKKAIGLKDMEASKEYNYTGEGVAIGILDSGVNVNHKDITLKEGSKTKYSQDEWNSRISSVGHGSYLSDKVPYGYDYVKNNNGCFADKDYHGYHVSGIAAANSEITGVAPGAQLLGMKVVGDEGTTRLSGVVDAIEDSIKLDADVLNMSFGRGGSPSDIEDYQSQAITKANQAGVLSVIAIGNDGTSDGRYTNTNYYKLTDTSMAGSPSVTKDALSVAAAYVRMDSGDIVTSMANFSSWGPSLKLEIKPEITAPGVDIGSTMEGTDCYEAYNGTSMATPCVAGCAALVKEDINKRELKSFYDNNRKIEGEELTAYMKNTLMNTAQIIYDIDNYDYADKVPYSVRYQGAGLVNVYNAVRNKVIATCNEQAKIELGEVESGSTNFTITLRNYGDKDATYEIVGGDAYEVENNGDRYCMKRSGGASISAGGSITVPARGEVTVSASLNVSSGCKENSYVEGYVQFLGKDVPDLVLPLLALYGDWNAEPIIDKPVYEEGESYLEKVGATTRHSDNVLKSRTGLVGGNSAYFGGFLGAEIVDNEVVYNKEHAAFSPKGLSNTVSVSLTQLRTAYEIEMSVLDENKNEIRYLAKTNDVRRMTLNQIMDIPSYQFCVNMINEWANSFEWNGKIKDNGDDYKIAKDGQYYIKISTKLYKGAKPQEIIMPVKIDTKIPKVSNSAVVDKDGYCKYVFNVSDNLAMESYVYLYIDGQVYNYEYAKLPRDEEGNYLLEIGELKDQDVYVVFTDMAGNDYVENIQQVSEWREHFNREDFTEDNVKPKKEDTFKIQAQLDKDIIEKEVTMNVGKKILLKENAGDKLAITVTCDGAHQIESIIATESNAGFDEVDPNKELPRFEGYPNADGSYQVIVDKSINWNYIELIATSSLDTEAKIIVDVSEYSSKDHYYENLELNDELYSDVAFSGLHIKENMLDDNEMYNLEGKFYILPKWLKINGEEVKVDPETKSYSYSYKPKFGINNIAYSYETTEGKVVEKEVKVYRSSMNFILDSSQNQVGIIRTNDSRYTIKGTIESYNTGYTIFVNGEKRKIDQYLLDIDGEKYDINKQDVEIDINLQPGNNDVVIKIQNHLGETIIKKLRIWYEAK